MNKKNQKPILCPLLFKIGRCPMKKEVLFRVLSLKFKLTKKE